MHVVVRLYYFDIFHGGLLTKRVFKYLISQEVTSPINRILIIETLIFEAIF